MDRASGYGPEGWGFESLQVHPSGDFINFDRISAFLFSKPLAIYEIGGNNEITFEAR